MERDTRAAVDDAGQQIPAELIRAEPVGGGGPLQPLGDVLIHAGGLIVKQHIREYGHENQENQKDHSRHGGTVLAQAQKRLPELAVFLSGEEIQLF